MNIDSELSEPARLLLLVSLLAKDRLISHNGELEHERSYEMYPDRPIPHG